MARSFIYLASPLASPCKSVRQERFRKTVDATARLIERGVVVFSPIVHNITLTENSNLEMGFDNWREFDLTMINAAHAVWVLNIDGWRESKGVTGELLHCYRESISTFLIDYETLKLRRLYKRELRNAY